MHIASAGRDSSIMDGIRRQRVVSPRKVYFRPRAYWQGVVDPGDKSCPDRIFPLDEGAPAAFQRTKAWADHQRRAVEGRYSELLAINLLEQLLLRRMAVINESL